MSDFSVEVWDYERFKKGRRFEGHSKKINDACFSNDNKLIFTCSMDFSLRIWDILSGKINYYQKFFIKL